MLAPPPPYIKHHVERQSYVHPVTDFIVERFILTISRGEGFAQKLNVLLGNRNYFFNEVVTTTIVIKIVIIIDYY